MHKQTAVQRSSLIRSQSITTTSNTSSMATVTSLAISLYPPKSTSHSPYPHPHPITSSIGFSTSISELGSQCNGLRFGNITVSKRFHLKDRRSRRRGNVVYASLFGVGAPEALVIGVVALLVFGPKGLAEVARNLGKTLRAFQPTIRELQDVSREFKSTLEREIGLDDIANPVQNSYTSTTSAPKSPPSPTSTSSSDTLQTSVDFNGSTSPSKAYTSEEYLKVTEEQLKAAAAAAWQQEQVSSTAEDRLISQQTQSESTDQESTSTALPPLPVKPEGDTSS